MKIREIANVACCHVALTAKERIEFANGGYSVTLTRVNLGKQLVKYVLNADEAQRELEISFEALDSENFKELEAVVIKHLTNNVVAVY